MKKRFLNLVAASLVLGPMALGANAVMAAGQGSLAAPSLVTTEGYDLAIGCVTNATKYAVDAAAVYCDAGSVLAVLPWSFSTTSCGADPDLTVTPADLAANFCLVGACPDPDPYTSLEPTYVSFKVKGLNPGQGNGRQNNPFSAWSPELPDLATVCDPT